MATSSCFCYQGIPLRSGRLAVDCSGSPPAMRSSAMSKMPATPPPTNATINHQAETIARPHFPWSRRHPGFGCLPPRPGSAMPTKKSPASLPDRLSACFFDPPNGIVARPNVPLCRVASNKLNSTAHSSVRTDCRGKGSSARHLVYPSNPDRPCIRTHRSRSPRRRTFVKL